MKQGWEIKKLGEVCEIVNGSTPLRTNKDFWENGNFPWFTIDDIREQGRIITATKQKVTEAALSKLRVLPVNTVLLCCTASVGEYAITKIELTSNQQFNGLIVRDKKNLCPDFLMHYCATLKDKLFELSGKTTIDFIAISKLKTLEIPLPPLAEQQRIVSILDKAFAAIDQAKAHAERNLRNARELFESYLAGVFENEENNSLSFGEVCELVGGSQPSKENFIFELKAGYVRLIQVRDYRTDKFVTYIPKSLAKRFCDKNDIMIGRYGPPIFGIFKGLEGAYNVALMKAIVNEKLCNRTYFYWFLQNKKIRDFVEQSSKRAVGQDGVRKELLEKYPVPVPPIKKQQSIVRQLDALRAKTQQLEAVYQMRIVDLEEMKKSILQKAFSGELKTT
jgi:type I restriction enzyme S subunit